jgi:hypothetical protein
MRSFGISVGIAGLARLLHVLFPAQAWLFETVAALAAVALVANLLFVLQDGFAAFIARFVRDEEAAYAGWGVCALGILSSFSLFGALGTTLWWLAVALGSVLLVFGIRDVVHSRQSIDPAHLGWFAWLGVTASMAPDSVAQALPALPTTLAVTGFVLAVLILVASLERVLRHRSFEGARSPWFAPGGAAGFAVWTVHHVQGPASLALLALLLALSLMWFIPVLQLVAAKHPQARAAWPNLFPLTSLALLSAHLQWTALTALLAAWALFIAGIEFKNHVPSTFRRALKRVEVQRRDLARVLRIS